MARLTVDQALFRADAHLRKGETAQARALYRGVLAAFPGNARAKQALALLDRPAGGAAPALPAAAEVDALLALYASGRMEAVVAEAERLLAAFPAATAVWNALGAACTHLGRLDQAAEALRRACALSPRYADAHNNLGNVLRTAGRPEEAAEAYRQALAIQPDHAGAHNNLGILLQAQGRIDAAVEAYRRALAIDPGTAELHNNLGMALKAQGRIEEAMAAYRQALAIRPDFADARLNLALATLTCGGLRAGWPDFEWRWKRPEAPRARPTGRPAWRGDASLQGRTILLWGEQGLGDQIQFARHAAAAAVAALGARVILELDPALVRLMAGIAGAERVVPGTTPVADADFDLHCPLMSLPLALGIELAGIPPPPRLVAHHAAVPRWAARLGDRAPRIGLAWSGQAAHANDRNRSLRLAELAPLLDDAADWISLQKELRPADREVLAALPRLRHFGEEITDFVDTAALCEQCDLVISVDTSLAHLAGTLGRPTWILLPFAPDWRWLLDRTDSPWYPGVRLYRQDRPGDWAGVLARVADDLRQWRAGRQA